MRQTGFLSIWATLTLMSCQPQQKQEMQEEVIPVKTIIAEKQTIVMPIHASGKLNSKTESKLSFKTGGIIERIYVDDGYTVGKGDLLARLNLEEIKSQVKQAELALQKATRDFTRAATPLPATPSARRE